MVLHTNSILAILTWGCTVCYVVGWLLLCVCLGVC